MTYGFSCAAVFVVVLGVKFVTGQKRYFLGQMWESTVVGVFSIMQSS